ncbi:MAG: PorP/SprF family type IX secretion system membrane protein [Phaeodactylibacter sp.]|nr:PorP/SprF family type IX secretion system membrane protein [Phaeodactylibacter sp.]MCB9276859.1 PorP/SprF family type IX secretion system membrane protein [Lewinellaceae bacterium]
MTRSVLLPVFLLLAAYCTQAQQLTLFTQYRDNGGILNPAAVESDWMAFGQNVTFGASYRAQWVGLDHAPRTLSARGSYLYADGSGVTLMAGGYLMNDQTGPTGFTGLYGRIAGIVTQDPEVGGFSIGLGAGAVNYRVNASEIRLRETGDIVGSTDQSQFFPDVSLGLFFYHLVGRNDDYFYAGLSVPQVIGLDLTFQDDNGEYTTKRIQHFYGMLGFYKFFDNDSFLEPSLWVKYAPGAPVNADLNLRYYLPVNFWIGAGGSTSGSVHLETGIVLGDTAGFDQTFRIGYGFGYSFSSFGPAAGTSHEINLAFSMFK